MAEIRSALVFILQSVVVGLAVGGAAASVVVTVEEAVAVVVGPVGAVAGFGAFDARVFGLGLVFAGTGREGEESEEKWLSGAHEDFPG